MVPYMSYWCGGYRKQPSEIILLMHKIACYFAKKHYGECHMLTDSRSKDLFKNLGFSSVTVMEDIDSIPLEYGQMWALGKIMAIKEILKKQQPFLHLDYDVFLFKKLPEFIEKAEAFAQSPEPTNPIYELNTFYFHCKNKYLLEGAKSQIGSNMGIFGGNNLTFFKNYSESSLNLILDKQNKELFTRTGEELGFGGMWSRAIIAEQYYYNVASDYYNIPITYLFDYYRPNEEDCAKYGYTHLWGAKDNPHWQNQIRQIAQKLNL